MLFRYALDVYDYMYGLEYCSVLYLARISRACGFSWQGREDASILVKASARGNHVGKLTPSQSCKSELKDDPMCAPPVSITGGGNNPNPALQNVPNISRSDSVVTVPLYDGANLCPGGACNVSKPIVGFLQLGIKRTIPPGGGLQLEAVILNASGCNPGAIGSVTLPVSGGGVSSVPVRLIHQ